MDKQTIFYFQQAGLQTTIQDAGRLGYQHLGIPIGGAMDQKAANLANWLVGNSSGAPVLEITLMGPVIHIKGNCQIALTGADISATLNGKSLSMYQTITIKKNSVLKFGALISGCRTYLAIGGTWQAKKWLSSYSPIITNGQELMTNSILKKGHQLMITTTTFISKRKQAKKLRPTYSNSLRVRVLAGPEFEQFSRTSIAMFFSHPHSISNHSNRMGYRLTTRLPDFAPTSELISSGIIHGTIQISKAGQPIILLRDAPTTGGYYRIATIHQEDLNLVAQLKPNDKIWFTLT